MQFAMGDVVFLKHKNHIVGSAIVSGITYMHTFVSWVRNSRWCVQVEV